MKKTIWVYGVIAGLICAIWMFGFMTMGKFEDFDKGLIYGYASMILAFSMIFVAIHTYKKNHGGGFITFKEAFKIGLFITLIASTFYVITWLYCFFYVLLPDFGDKYVAYSIEKMKAGGAAQAEIDAYALEMKTFGEQYKNPFFNAAMTYLEIIPVGLLISLISALILKKKPFAAPL